MPSADRWAEIERASCDPDLVACVALQEHVLDEGTVSESRLAAIEEVGLPGVRQDIMGETGISNAEFELSLVMCQEAVREAYGLEERIPGDNYC